MKFFGTASVLSLVATGAHSAIAPRQGGTTVVGTFNSVVTTLQSTLAQDEAIIQSNLIIIAGAAGGNTALVAAAQQAIGNSLQGATAALTTASQQITAATTNGAGTVEAAAATLTQSEVNQVTADVGIVQNIVSNLGATITLTAGSAGAVTSNFVQTELAAAQKAIAPFVGPVLNYTSAVTTFSAGGGVAVTGLQIAAAGLQIIVQTFLKSIGLPI